jgi:hypothetical protein
VSASTLGLHLHFIKRNITVCTRDSRKGIDARSRIACEGRKSASSSGKFDFFCPKGRAAMVEGKSERENRCVALSGWPRLRGAIQQTCHFVARRGNRTQKCCSKKDKQLFSLCIRT